MRQPPAGSHTVTPVPGSVQERVQQFDAPSHGVPPWPQPPDGVRQRPGVAAGVVVPVEQPPEQQSWFR
ncbi:MAG TPA: hypothetical protein VF912_01080 [Anaeromyxobacter sp.]